MDDGCTVRALQHTEFFIRWAGAGTAGVNTSEGVKKKKKRNSPKN